MKKIFLSSVSLLFALAMNAQSIFVGTTTFAIATVATRRKARCGQHAAR